MLTLSIPLNAAAETSDSRPTPEAAADTKRGPGHEGVPADSAKGPGGRTSTEDGAAPEGGAAERVLTPQQLAKLEAVQRAVASRDAAAVEVSVAVDAANLAAEQAGRASDQAMVLREQAAAAQLAAGERELHAARVRVGVDAFARGLAIAGPGGGQEALLGLVLYGDRPAEVLRQMEASERIGAQTARTLREVVHSTEQAQQAREAAATAAAAAATSQAEAVQRAREAADILLLARTRLLAEQQTVDALADGLPSVADLGLGLPVSLTPSGTLGCLPTIDGVEFLNGMLPDSVLCGVPSAPGHKLRTDAASTFERLSGAFARVFGTPLCITDSYRTFEAQVDLKRRKPYLAATPGTSNHGWGMAIDACGGVESFGTAEHEWMRSNAPMFGWFHPGWAQADGSKPEPWHWEHSPELAEQMAAAFTATTRTVTEAKTSAGTPVAEDAASRGLDKPGTARGPLRLDLEISGKGVSASLDR